MESLANTTPTCRILPKCNPAIPVPWSLWKPELRAKMMEDFQRFEVKKPEDLNSEYSDFGGIVVERISILPRPVTKPEKIPLGRGIFLDVYKASLRGNTVKNAELLAGMLIVSSMKASWLFPTGKESILTAMIISMENTIKWRTVSIKSTSTIPNGSMGIERVFLCPSTAVNIPLGTLL